MIGRLRSRKGAIVAVGLAACLGSLLLGVYGGVASGSEPRLSWYACVQGGAGPYEYEDSKCSKASKSGIYWWTRVTNRTFSSSNTIVYKIRYTALSESEIQCKGASGSGKLKGYATGAGIEEYTLNLTECVPTVPSGLGCKIAGGGISLPLTGVSPVPPETLKSEMKMSLASTVSFFMEGCTTEALNGTYNITGGFPAQVDNSQSSMYTTATESKGQLKINGGSASIEGSSGLLATGYPFGSVPVKLDTAP